MNRFDPQLIKDLVSTIPSVSLKRRAIKSILYEPMALGYLRGIVPNRAARTIMDELTMGSSLHPTSETRISGLSFCAKLEEFISSSASPIKEKIIELEKSILLSIPNKGFLTLSELAEASGANEQIMEIVVKIYDELKWFDLEKIPSSIEKLMDAIHYEGEGPNKGDLLRILGRITSQNASHPNNSSKFSCIDDYKLRRERETELESYARTVLNMTLNEQKIYNPPIYAVISFEVSGKDSAEFKTYPCTVSTNISKTAISFDSKQRREIPFPLDPTTKELIFSIKVLKNIIEMRFNLKTSSTKIVRKGKYNITVNLSLNAKCKSFQALEWDDFASNILIASFRTCEDTVPIMKLQWILSAADPITVWTAFARQSLPFLRQVTIPLFAEICLALEELIRRTPATEDETSSMEQLLKSIKNQAIAAASFKTFGSIYVIEGNVEESLKYIVGQETAELNSKTTNAEKASALESLLIRINEVCAAEHSVLFLPSCFIMELGRSLKFIDSEVLHLLSSDINSETIGRVCSLWKTLRANFKEIDDETMKQIIEWISSRSLSITNAVKNIIKLEDFTPVKGRGASSSIYDLLKLLSSVENVASTFPDLFLPFFQEQISSAIRLYCIHHSKIIAHAISQQRKSIIDPIPRNQWAQFAVSFSNCAVILKQYTQAKEFFSMSTIENTFIASFMAHFRKMISDYLIRKPRFVPACVHIPKTVLRKDFESTLNTLYVSLEMVIQSMKDTLCSIMEEPFSRKFMRALALSLDQAVISWLASNVPMRRKDLKLLIISLIDISTKLFEKGRAIMDSLRDSDVGSLLSGIIFLNTALQANNEALIGIAKNSIVETQRKCAFIILHLFPSNSENRFIIKALRSDFNETQRTKKKTSR